MPKKTRKQKLRADVRHKSFALPVTDQSSTAAASYVPATFQFQSAQRDAHRKTPDNQEEFIAIRSDLSRTIVLAVIAVTVELALYWRFFRM